MLIFGLHGLHLLGGGVFFEWRNEWFTDIPSLCHHQWQCCSCKAPKNEARQQMAHGPIGQGWSLEFQVWPSPIISLCLQLIFRAKLDGRWTMQLKVLADLNLWRPQSLRRLFLGMGSKHQVISSLRMGTKWGYSIRYTPHHFKDLTANAVLAQDPNQQEKKALCTAMPLWNAANSNVGNSKLPQQSTSGTGINLFTGYQP